MLFIFSISTFKFLTNFLDLSLNRNAGFKTSPSLKSNVTSFLSIEISKILFVINISESTLISIVCFFKIFAILIL